ncbi:prephenate dehydrogenase [Flagellimonas marinaquae]|uniref:Prephenate dehydrogenase n=1 Tax=Flagellimonas aurea TaxID=2915619 RepID=A0ABS3G6J7_9FLAO|nr:prephenate dehydrogenase [Allomuricauda aurea]MAO17018.1 prephenate dehydrogenase [Allomuricauda sp.]MBC70880.1 prephenate dehydrogenase [Allomuricauda sp.]MBO0354533.1 prephenate dehydrogenase [Allomuricauda aurea]UBZ12710.1 prephenate dehydrogenase [Allomuricauda aquimarina]|tara:strand:+ start:990 stop:1850 length:861 start_codon:yes stop_codon:yes gene_type:complete
MKVVIIGVGLIGGSFAKDVKKVHPEAEIIGVDKSEAHLDEALQLQIIDKKGDYQDLETADLVYVSIPVNVLVSELPKILDTVGDETVVMDAGSTKRLICEQVADHPKRRNFMACHPIAGTEFSGPTAALEGLYAGKTMIICEVEKTAFKLQEPALAIFQEIGMRIRYMNPEAHDKHIAYVSHLSHISSFMLGKTVIEKEKNERDIFDMAGSGFESTVRLAKSSPDMWTPIFEQNKDNVVETLEEYIENLTRFKQLIVDNDFENVHQEMSNTNKIKQILKGIPLTKK